MGTRGQDTRGTRGRGVTHRSLDGVRVRLAGDHDLRRPCTSVARIAEGGRLHEISSGTREDALAWAADIGVDRFEQEFRVQGGRLRVGRTATRDAETGLSDPVLAAVWEGRRHAVFTHLYHGRPADAVAFFDTVRLTEHEDGVTAVPRGRARRPEPAEMVKEVPGIGLLEITALTTVTRRRLPPWRGASVAGGELFRDAVEGQGPYFLLALKSLLVTVLPEEDRVRDVPRRLAGLAVEAVR
ncbi:hypothetical protein BKA00_003326 [Actinomadura coerulea]|uniref:Uncharacterized protein n=1 Tax=Actinomadura coerulea TaxID=46159 RepID=A0A7X0G0B1_9ACTN|nr:hypothetical protein [Actinomadura coerulea]MBB6396412.1 hypothetical protein [Actinomadura coerulea]GGQ06393.1 hypothetical protein GCM10010187_23040 [Actinomadura coerulea]